MAQANPKHSAGTAQPHSAQATSVRQDNESKRDNWIRQEAKRVSMIPAADITDPDPDAKPEEKFAAKARRRSTRLKITKNLEEGARKTHMTIGAFAGEVYGRLTRDYRSLTAHHDWFRRTYKIGR